MKERLKPIHTERLQLRISKELLEKVKAKARENEMSIAAYVRSVLKNELKKG